MSKIEKRIVIILSIIFSLLLLLEVLYFTFLYDKEITHQVIFTFYDNNHFTREVKSEMSLPKVRVFVDNKDMSNIIECDSSNLNLDLLGEYELKYSITYEDVKYNSSLKVKVVDTTSPIITLNGEEEITILTSDKYEELGAKASDNYDGDITSKIVTEGKVDTSKEGEYEITYKVSDTSGNTSSKIRKVKVMKPKQVIIASNYENKEKIEELIVTNYSNTISSNKFTNTGFYIEGYKKDNNGNFKLELRGSENYIFDLIDSQNGRYKGNIDLSNVSNGNYQLYISSNSEEKLVSKLSPIAKIGRAKIGNKLVTFNYENDEVNVNISDFAYQYDVLIDPGHGGSDVGSSNEYIYEKDMNLTVSKYEKCRFESHGYKVYMTRDSDTYGNGMGDSSLLRIQRRAYEMGYIGAVSKIVYSNHHNAISNPNYMGYEILFPGYLTAGELENELSIVSKFNNIYPLKENHLRFYATDYDTEIKYSKLEGKVYNFKDNYAVNRIPHDLFNVKSIIYENAYLTNKEDFNWYWNSKNWIKISEAKLEVYINSLGGNYNPDNSACL